MAGVFSRLFNICKFSFLHKRFSSRSHVSTLFVPGRHGADMYQIVKPVIDINYIASNIGNLKLSCDHRGIQIDLDYVLEVAREWLNIKDHYSTVLQKDAEYKTKILNSHTLGPEQKIEVLKNEKEKHDEFFQAEKEKLHAIEDIFMPLFQKIPHILHPSTPLQFNIIEACQELPTFEAGVKSCTEIAKDITFLDYASNPSISYFMTGKLSELDFSIQMYFLDKLNSYGFFPLSGVDFCKSFIIEAVGSDPYSSFDCITIKGKGNRELGQKLNLVGGASFEIFCAYLANMNTDKSTLPIKYFALGRRYNAANKCSNSRNLFSVVQSNNVHGLILSEECTMKYFDTLLQVIIECYTELGVPFRIVNIAAKNLTVAESHKKQLELWSPALKEYVPVAYVSQHDDFVSKRLQITYGSEHVKEGYCGIVEGTIVNVSALMGCIIENYQVNENFNVPPVLEKYMTFSE